MKKITLLFFLFSSLIIHAQTTTQEKINARLIDLHRVADNDENFEGYEQIKKEIGDAKIVMLGEQSHTDATTFETKIKLIKYLHQEMDFDILAFESNIYECERAWSMVQKGHDVKDAIAKGMFGVWASVEELNPLYQYFEQQLKTEHPLIYTGFDPQFYGNLAEKYFEQDLLSYLATFEKEVSYKKEIKQLQSFIITKGRKIRKKKAIQNIAFIQKLIGLLKNKQNDELADSWIQMLRNLEIWISDTKLKTDNRDEQMADNLIWLKERYPDKKIICWGATSHFLYNSSSVRIKNKIIQKLAGEYYQKHSMMGDYVKKKYGDDLYTIGFIAHEGTFGLNGPSTIKAPLENSLEYLIGQSDKDNYFLPLKELSLEGYLSRPLGHKNMVNDIARVMDGVVFNRYMRRPYTDWDFLFYLVGENYLRPKKVEKLKKYSELRKQRDKAESKKRNPYRA